MNLILLKDYTCKFSCTFISVCINFYACQNLRITIKNLKPVRWHPSNIWIKWIESANMNYSNVLMKDVSVEVLVYKKFWDPNIFPSDLNYSQFIWLFRGKKIPPFLKFFRKATELTSSIDYRPLILLTLKYMYIPNLPQHQTLTRWLALFCFTRGNNYTNEHQVTKPWCIIPVYEKK